MIIANNLAAMYTERNLKLGNDRLKKSTEKLSSGYRINRSADDAAGLAISEKMRSQIRGLHQASKNIGDGISYVQVADGGLSEVQSILNRMTQLSVKSANDINTELDRQAIDDEMQQLKKAITDIFNDTEFNKKKIWDDNPNNRVQIGVEQIPAVTSGTNITTSTLNNTNKASIPNNGLFKLNADASGITVTWNAYNGTSYTSDVIEWPATLEGNHSFQLSDYLDTAANPELAGINFTYSYHVAEAATLADVVNSLNGADISCSPYNNVNTIAYTEDGTPMDGVSFSAYIDYPALLGSDKNFNYYDDLFIEASVSNVVTENNLTYDPTEADSSGKWEFEFEMPQIGTVKATSTSTYYYSTWKDPDKNWWYHDEYGDFTKTFTPSPSNGSLDSVNASLENPGLDLVNDTITGGVIVVSFDLNTMDGAYTLDDGSSHSYVGGVYMYINVDADDTIESINDKLKKLSGIDIDAGNKNTNEPSNTYYGTITNGVNEVLIDSPIYKSTNIINIQSGANNNEYIPISYDSLNTSVIGIRNTSVLTRDEAENAIGEVANALDAISAQRSLFGAYQNRLEHAGANVGNAEENTAAAESLIRDTDMASEMVNYSKEQILQQVGQSLLVQANSINQGVLKLLS